MDVSDIPLVLGPVVFEGFELPTHITVGGRQRLAVHRLADGSRVVDVLGPDESDLAWTGVMSGPLAATRAQTIDALRTAGGQLNLSFGGWFAAVVVSAFSADANMSGWVPYRITCTVLSEPPEVDTVLGQLDALTWPGDPGSTTGLGGLDLSSLVAAAGTLATACAVRSSR